VARGAAKKVLRIRYADNENELLRHLPDGGKVLADRSLSRLMKSDWPRTLDELESSQAPVICLSSGEVCRILPICPIHLHN